MSLTIVMKPQNGEHHYMKSLWKHGDQLANNTHSMVHQQNEYIS